MDNLWILTEEKPKISVIKEIIGLYCRDFSGRSTISERVTIVPIITNDFFEFYYKVEGIKLNNCQEIIISTVSGSSSFFDFLVFKQTNKPKPTEDDNLLMVIEETKTSGQESRNTGIYQRASKFVYVEHYFKNIKKYMLYNEELENNESVKPADTIIFGTNMFLSLDIDIIGKETEQWFSKFNNIQELIDYKNGMRQPPAGNVPIEIVQKNNRIEISGRLSKPADQGNIGHDPNIGALSLIAKTLRYLGWQGDIIITQHGVSQGYINKTGGRNKFLYICKILNLKLEGIILPENINLPSTYWHYEMRSEKMASILLHILAENKGLKAIYQNHAGCERGYFVSKEGNLIALPKKDQSGENLYIPDLVLYSERHAEVILIEGKKLSTLNQGVEEIELYDSIENEFIKKYYPNCSISRYLTIFGGALNELPHENVLFYLRDDGKIITKDIPEKSMIEIFQNYSRILS
ncbi:MAG: hypothetical protein R3Y28_04870 [Candidatus Gastranaerophilales bacterium]